MLAFCTKMNFTNRIPLLPFPDFILKVNSLYSHSTPVLLYKEE